MRMYLDDNVVERGRKRVRAIVQEFDDIVVTISGGKDSGVLFDLVYTIAEEEDELPIYCLWIDQEAEYQATVDEIEKRMEKDGVIPLWCQFQLEITNGAGNEDATFTAWDPELDEDEWIRPKKDYAIKDNTYDTNKLTDLFEIVIDDHVDSDNIATMGGVRAGESPNRYLGLTAGNVHKGITWGAPHDSGIKTFYPIYDWTYSDIWKYTLDNDLSYNDVYDKKYKYGENVRDMRISHLHHQMAVHNIAKVKEYEPDTYDKLVERTEGIHSTTQLGGEDFLEHTDLPYMFKDWREYRNYLTEHLIDEEYEDALWTKFMNLDLIYEHTENYKGKLIWMAWCVLQNDVIDFDKLDAILRSASDREMKVRDLKIEWLKENKPEVWEEVKEYASGYQTTNREAVE
jgi:predicted phosphoadenosine phosphosulfate sulfurtransferase